ncbi:hypothetical protein X801_10589 [Opisthorchis viverrini]|uniref:hydroxymethylglutaryl-CoA lyase n=1 Tax=Opisthorchis viverrini TaxID=6198 RepID=A0A1S8WGR0_OPIVI|nr:hypothetical protein X801_10589 [Opisthorchis viverrini]
MIVQQTACAKTFFWVPYRRLSTSRGLIKLVEVGPRDGLQNEKVTVPTHVKVELVNNWVPQLADAGEVFGSITRNSGTKYIALVPNRTGMEKALKANVDEVAVFTAASEKFSKTNINCTIDESMKNIEQVDYCLAASCGFLYNDPIEDFSPSNLVYVKAGVGF